MLTDNFLLFVDPAMKGVYQVDLSLIGWTPGGPAPGLGVGVAVEQVRGIDVRTGNAPARAAFDLRSRDLYWHDTDQGVGVVKRMSLTTGDIAEHSLTVLAQGTNQPYSPHGANVHASCLGPPHIAMRQFTSAALYNYIC